MRELGDASVYGYNVRTSTEFLVAGPYRHETEPTVYEARQVDVSKDTLRLDCRKR